MVRSTKKNSASLRLCVRILPFFKHSPYLSLLLGRGGTRENPVNPVKKNLFYILLFQVRVFLYALI